MISDGMLEINSQFLSEVISEFIAEFFAELVSEMALPSFHSLHLIVFGVNLTVTCKTLANSVTFSVR